MNAMAPRRSRWSWKIGELWGISIRVHITLLVLLAWVVVDHAIRGTGLADAALGVLLVGLVFAIIVAHELGHALVARRYGCRTREIFLLPIGGVAELDRMPERPRHELLVALAGPGVNVALALVLGLVAMAIDAPLAPARAATIGGAITSQLLWINIALAAFNLLPAFPMDGGRVLRALLAMRLGHARATQIASTVGRVLAGVLIVAGLFVDLMLVLIGAFVWLAAAQESAILELRSILAGGVVEDAMISPPVVVDGTESIEHGAALVVAAGHRELAVVDRGRLAGVVGAAELSSARAAGKLRGEIAEVMRTGIPLVAPSDPLAAVSDRVESAGAAFVVDGGKLVGLLTTEQLAVYAALHAPPRTHRPRIIPITVRAS